MPQPPTSAITLTGVRFRYAPRETGTDTLKNTNLAIEAGELVFIVGPNGAGKSTLLRLIAGLLRPLTGVVRCRGLNPFFTPRPEVARVLSYLPQFYDLTFPLQVAEVVLLGRYAHGRSGLRGFYTRSSDVAIADAAMERCDVLELRDRRWNELSGGEQRRVLLAQALCQDTEILLLDEPTSSLDPAHAIEILDAVRGREDGTSIVVTHDLNLAARYASRIIVVAGGKVVADGEPHAVLSGSELSAAFGLDLHVGVLPNSDTRYVVPKSKQ